VKGIQEEGGMEIRGMNQIKERKKEGEGLGYESNYSLLNFNGLLYTS
jgi:hypothetical protein